MRRIGLGALLASLLFVPLLISAGNPLLQRIEALEAELDTESVVIDANGVEVGEVVGIAAAESDASHTLARSSPVVLVGVEGFPLFLLAVNRKNFPLQGTTIAAYFLSDDCSGQVTQWGTLYSPAADEPRV